MTTTAYADERIRLLRKLRQEANGASLSELLRPSAAELRFRLGTSLADLRIPFRIHPALRQIVDVAAIDAYLLAAGRHKPSIVPSEYDKLVVIQGFDPAALRALSFQPPTAVTRDAVRRTFFEAMEAHTGVDAGLVASFLGTGRPGRTLAATLHALFVRAKDEAGRSDVGEPTAYLVSLMLRTLAERSFLLTKDAPVGEPMARYLRSATASLLCSAAQLALREAGLWRDSGVLPAPPVPAGQPAPNRVVRDWRETRSALLSVASLGLLPFLGQRPGIAASGLAAYGVLFDGQPPRLDETMARLAGGEDPEQAARELAGTVARERETQRRCERLGAMAAIRDHAREIARLAGSARGFSWSVPPEGPVERLVILREGVEKLFASEPRRKDLARLARDAVRLAPSDELRHRLEVLAHAAREFRDDEPAAWMGATDARLRTAHAVVALASDLFIERQVQSAAALLLERTGSETEGGESAEYESGRLYLLSLEDQPVLKARAKPPQVGHLFCDMKDFTRRTAFLKESVIADFLQREFYAPILTAASGLDPGSRSPDQLRPVQLNNLLGDAVSFSGDIVVLVRLTGSILQTLRDYGRRLEAEGSQEAVTARVKELETLYRVRREALERNLRELTLRAPKADPLMREAMLLRAKEQQQELARLTGQFQAELARAAGEKLEAGIFVSYGAAPEVARFDDPVFGPIKVAIAEKINESARGTARAGSVRDKVMARLEQARLVTGRTLQLPFRVLVDTPTTLPIPPEQALAFSDALQRRDELSAQAILADVMRRAVAQPPSAAGELYNGGAALSEEALTAYLEARGNEVVVLRREVAAGDLAPQLWERFFFPQRRLALVGVVAPGQRALQELFVFQGRVLFRGFEATGGMGIWEMVDPNEPFFQLLAQHHLADWLRQG